MILSPMVWLNCDGPRTAEFSPGSPDDDWAAVATMPQGKSNVDLQLRERAIGAESGFDEALAASYPGVGSIRLGLGLLESTQPRPAGRHTLVWEGRDDQGQAVASGVYFVRLSASGIRETRKVSLIK